MKEKLTRCPNCGRLLDGYEEGCYFCIAVTRNILPYDEIVREIFLLKSPKI